MAFQLPKINLADAKTRILIIVAGVIGFVIMIYIGKHFFSSPTAAAGPSHVANAPGNLQSVPGGQLTPEYYRALVQANAQAAKQAQISGGSAVPTLLNEPGAQPSFQQPSTPSCTVVCPTEDNVNVENDINDLVKSGKLSAEEGKKLADLAKQNVAVSDYAAHLDQLVKQGKLTPEQARKLLEDYKKQHDNALARESGAAMDELIKSGQLPIDAANELLDMQKKHVSPAEYADKLSELVKEGKISPQTAAQLLAQYSQQNAREASAEAVGQLEEMAASGQIKPEVAKELEDYQRRHVPEKEYEEELDHLVKQGKLTPEQARRLLAQYRQQVPPDVANDLADFQKRNVPVAEYQAELQKLVAAGKITPEQAQQLLDQYRQVKTAASGEGTMGDAVKQAERANQDAVRELAETGKISPETAQLLTDLQRSHVPVEEYKKQLDDLVRQGKLNPADAQRLLTSYMQQRGAGVQDLLDSGKISPDTAKKLMDLQHANVPVEEYKRQLDQLVREGKISAGDAQRLLGNYSQMKQEAGVAGLLSSGAITPETAQTLSALEKAKVPVDEYKRQLDKLVQEGKISPDDAQKLLKNYMQQRGDGVQDLLDGGKISQSTADKLVALQRANVPVDEYKKQLDQMVKEGRLSRADADKLLNNYEQVRGAGVQDLLSSGKISPDTAQKLLDLQRSNVPVDEYKRQLDQMVREGKISADDAKKLLNNYQQMKGGNVVQDLANTHRISPESEQQLLEMQRANVPVDEYKKQLDQLVKDGKISPQEAANLLSKYQKLHGVREESDRLAAMRANNASPGDYAAELKRAVAAGTLTPEQATRLMQEYQAAQAQQAVAISTTPLPDVKGAPEFAALQKRIQAAAPTVTPLKPSTTPQVQLPSNEQMSAAQAKAKALAEQQEQQRLQALMGAMSQQAGQLINSWQPPVMSGQVGSAEKDFTTTTTTKTVEKGGSKESSSSSSASGGAASAGPIIKAGTIFYAILDTAVNSDFPDSPVLATIVSGKFKGAKLLGKLAITQGQDRVSLTFKLMNMDEWPTGKTVNAYAMDPDTARTALASDVNYHYMLRYGGLFASSFITGYSQSIMSSGATTSLSVTGSTTTNPVLSPSSKLIAGLGGVGQAFGKAVQSYTTTPPTVKIDPGVSLGILFMADVSG